MTTPTKAPTELEFTEEMKGYVTFGEQDFHAGFAEGKKAKTFLMVHLTIVMDDAERFVADPSHQARATGWVECEAIGGRLPLKQGTFNLFVSEEDKTRSQMRYRLFFSDGVGDPRTLTGFKDVRDDPGFDVWADTSTLYTRLYAGHVEADEEDGAEVTASGILSIYLLDFMQQMTTFRTRGPSVGDRAKALTNFNRLFLGKLFNLYGPLARDQEE